MEWIDSDGSKRGKERENKRTGEKMSVKNWLIKLVENAQ